MPSPQRYRGARSSRAGTEGSVIHATFNGHDVSLSSRLKTHECGPIRCCSLYRAVGEKRKRYFGYHDRVYWPKIQSGSTKESDYVRGERKLSTGAVYRASVSCLSSRGRLYFWVRLPAIFGRAERSAVSARNVKYSHTSNVSI